MQSFAVAAKTEFQSPSQLSSDSSKSNKASPGICHLGSIDSEVKRRIQMLEQQTSSALQGKNGCVSMCCNPFMNIHRLFQAHTGEKCGKHYKNEIYI